MELDKGALLLGAIAVVAVLWSVNKSCPSGPPARQAPRVAGPAVGNEVYLTVSSGMVVLCVDETAYREFTKLAMANDTLGMFEQTLRGQSFLVPSGTRALLIETGFDRRRVRVLEGEQMGRSGWVTASLVQRN